jgi:alanyl-tRNA synthetase
MQQHTGQHILSAAFLDEMQANTIGFHMGFKSSTIDLDIPTLADKDLRKVEDIANRVVWENRAVNIYMIRDDEVDTIPFRKPPQVSGLIRVIWVEGYDASACGGTHVQHTGEVGVIKITGKEHYKGGIRVTFLCGKRALEDYQRVLEKIQNVSANLSIHQDELGETVTRMQGEIKSTKRELTKIRKTLMEFEAKILWKNTPETEGIRKVFAHWENYSFADIRAIAEALRQHPKALILLGTTEDKNIRLLCTRSEDLSHVDASKILKKAAENLHGRGGGSLAMAQGGAPKTKHKTVMEAFQKAILDYFRNA